MSAEDWRLKCLPGGATVLVHCSFMFRSRLCKDWKAFRDQKLRSKHSAMLTFIAGLLKKWGKGHKRKSENPSVSYPLFKGTV